MKQMKPLNLKKFKVTQLDPDQPVTPEAVANAVDSFFTEAENARNQVEETWLECYAQYLGTPETVEWLRDKNVRNEAIANDWRHKIHMAKGYELVETVVAYLFGAMFPNSNWFGMVPKKPNLANKLPILENFFRDILREGEFKTESLKFLRQLCIIGSSVMSLPWDAYRETPVYETLDMFDFYPDPNAKDINKSDVVRILRKTRAEIADLVANGTYEGIDPIEILNLPASTIDNRLERRTIQNWMGVELTDTVSMFDVVDCLDYWGNITIGTTTLKDVHAVVVGGHLVKLERNPFEKVGRPFVFGTFVQVPHIVYPHGLLHPVLGQLAMIDIVHNQVLDNGELANNKMYGYVDDGVIDPEAIRNDPGNLIEMASPDSLFPLPTGGLDSIGYLEIDVLNTSIDRAVGAGPLVSAGPGRDGERVTAAEVQATRDAGGNRLNLVHRTLEIVFLIPTLRRSWKMLKTYRKSSGVTRIKVGRDNSAYIEVPPSELTLDVDFRVTGADHVVDRERNIQEILDYVAAVSSNPELAVRQNWDELTTRVAQTFDIFEDIEAIVTEPPAPEPDPAVLQAEQQALAQQQALEGPLPVSLDGQPLPGVAESLQQNTPLALDPTQLNYLLQQGGTQGLTDNIAPAGGFPPVNNAT